ncbi:MAG: hypothetical protein KIT58_19585, partial [Planctomycetota bacterium]|nr:hypothetical protein [Planctomycetota bacterium]
LTAGLDEVSLWDAPRGETPRRRARVTPLQDEGETRVTCAALAGEGGVVVGTNRWVRLWDPGAERTELMPLLHDAHIRSAVARGGRDVLAGLTNGWLMRLQVGPDALLTGPRQEKAPLEAHLADLARLGPTDLRRLGVMTEVAASRRGGLLCGVLWDGRLVLWRADRGEVTTSREGQGAFVRGLAIEPRERLVASAGDDGAVRLWSPDGALLDTLSLRAGEGPCGLAFSPDGERLLVGTTRGVVLELEVDADR